MDFWLEKYRPLFQAADDGATAAAEPVADQAPTSEPVAAEPAAEPAPQHGNTGKQPWFLGRISEEAAGRRAAEERLVEKDRQLAEAQALVQRLQAGDKPSPATVPAPRGQDADPNRRAEIQREAAAQRFYEDTLEVKNKGIAKFGGAFGETLNILGALGATNDEFIADVLAIDKPNAHVLLKEIAKDPERAAALAQMNSRQRIAELTRMTMTTAQTPAKTEPAIAAAPAAKISKAPPPAPAVQQSASKVVDGYSDDASDDEFTAQFNERMAKRAARR